MNVHRSTAQVLPTNNDNIAVIPLNQGIGAAGDQMTGWMPIRKVGPIDLKAGTQVDIRASEQIDNETQGRAGDPWKENIVRNVSLRKTGKLTQDTGHRYKVTALPTYSLEVEHAEIDLDPRRTLWVMVELAVYRGTDPTTINGAKQVIRNQGENADNSIHHWRWSDSDWDSIDKDAPGSWYFTVVRFAWSAQYWISGAKMEVLDRGRISATTY